MAFRMRYWLAATAAGCLLVAVLKLPPEHRYANTQTVEPAEQIRLQLLERDLRETGEILRRVQWMDSLAPLIAESTSPVQVLYPEGEWLAADQIERMHELVQADVDRYAGTPKMKFAVVWQPNDFGTYPGMSVGGANRSEIYAGTHNGSPYCVRMNVINRSSLIGHLSRELTYGRRLVGPSSNLLGACSWYLRYGMPGRSIEAWLSQGGAEFSEERGSTEDVDVVRSRWLFGQHSTRRDTHVQQCRGGVAEACAQIFATPSSGREIQTRNARVIAESPLIWTQWGSYGLLVSEFEDYFFDHLEREFGHEAFAAFWSSDQEAPAAFEAAFGTDVGTWMVDWLDRTRGLERSSPALPRSASAGSALAILALLGLAYRAQQRRTAV